MVHIPICFQSLKQCSILAVKLLILFKCCMFYNVAWDRFKRINTTPAVPAMFFRVMCDVTDRNCKYIRSGMSSPVEGLRFDCHFIALSRVVGRKNTSYELPGTHH